MEKETNAKNNLKILVTVRKGLKGINVGKEKRQQFMKKRMQKEEEKDNKNRRRKTQRRISRIPLKPRIVEGKVDDK
jgi:hypothetical protein